MLTKMRFPPRGPANPNGGGGMPPVFLQRSKEILSERIADPSTASNRAGGGNGCGNGEPTAVSPQKGRGCRYQSVNLPLPPRGPANPNRGMPRVSATLQGKSCQSICGPPSTASYRAGARTVSPPAKSTGRPASSLDT
jgi:hypothetical protein